MVPEQVLIPLVKRSDEYCECRNDVFGITKECVRANGVWYVEYHADSLPDCYFECWAGLRDAMNMQVPVGACVVHTHAPATPVPGSSVHACVLPR